jgi:hypothetical protein
MLPCQQDNAMLEYPDTQTEKEHWAPSQCFVQLYKLRNDTDFIDVNAQEAEWTRHAIKLMQVALE